MKLHTNTTLQRAIFLFGILLLGFSNSKATHIVGGELNYECLGNDTYEISLTVFRDCFNGNPNAYFDDPASIGIFDVNNNLAIINAQKNLANAEARKLRQQAETGQQPGEPSNSDSSPPNPASESGEGEMPPGADEVDLLRGAIGDGDWGDLRRRGVEDAAQGRSSRIPPGYSREVNAYFKALSKRAAESKE